MKSFVDLHNDVITNLQPADFFRYVTHAGKAGVETILVSVWTTEMENPLQQIQHYRHALNNIKTEVCLLLHIEDAWFVNEQNISELIACKPYSVGLTWNTNNNLAGGANSDGKLTPLGNIILEKLTSNKILIDLAHLNRQSFYEIADFLTSRNQRLFCTHTCFNEINPHQRNLDRRQIQMIVDSGGLIGLTLVSDFLCANGNATLHDVYNHIAYFIKTFGDNNFAIGTDFFGTAKLPAGLNEYKDFRKLKEFLINKGLSEESIDKILYSNARKFLKSPKRQSQ